MCEKLGGSLGEVEDMGLFEVGGSSPPFLKAKIKLDIRKSIKKGITIGNRLHGAYWVDFRYEKLPQCCYICGLLGHEEDECTAHQNSGTEKFKSLNLGPWIRTLQQGRKIRGPNDKSSIADQEESNYSVGKVKQVDTESILQQIAAMSVNTTSNLEEKNDQVGSVSSVQMIEQPVVSDENIPPDENATSKENPTQGDFYEKTTQNMQPEVSKGKKWKRLAREKQENTDERENITKRDRTALLDISNISGVNDEMDVDHLMPKKLKGNISLDTSGGTGGSLYCQES